MGDMILGIIVGALLTAFAINTACENVMSDACAFGIPLSDDKEGGQ